MNTVQFRVYHNIDAVKFTVRGWDTLRGANMTHVATVTVPHEEGEPVVSMLNTVYELTNHIDWDWTTNDGVKHVAGIFPRSTMAGDVIVDTRFGHQYLVARVGFTEIDLPIQGERIINTQNGATGDIVQVYENDRCLVEYDGSNVRVDYTFAEYRRTLQVTA